MREEVRAALATGGDGGGGCGGTSLLTGSKMAASDPDQAGDAGIEVGNQA